MTPTEASTEPTPDVLWLADNWLSFSSDPPPSIAWLMEQEQRDKRVGELLREQHYFDTSNPHPLMARGNYPNEEAFWLGQARMYPGLVVSEMEARRLARMSASSTAALQAA